MQKYAHQLFYTLGSLVGIAVFLFLGASARAEQDKIDTFDFESFFTTMDSSPSTRPLNACYLNSFGDVFRKLESLYDPKDERKAIIYFLELYKLGGYTGIAMSIQDECEASVKALQGSIDEETMAAVTVGFLNFTIKAEREVWNRCLDLQEYNSKIELPCKSFNPNNKGERKSNQNNPWARKQTTAPPKPPPNVLTIPFKNSSNSLVNLRFFSQNRNNLWPDANNAWALSSSTQQSFSLECNPGESICWGASQRLGSGKGYGVSWGVGVFGRNACKGCCLTCGQTYDLVNLQSGKEKRKKPETAKVFDDVPDVAAADDENVPTEWKWAKGGIFNSENSGTDPGMKRCRRDGKKVQDAYWRTEDGSVWRSSVCAKSKAKPGTDNVYKVRDLFSYWALNKQKQPVYFIFDW